MDLKTDRFYEFSPFRVDAVSRTLSKNGEPVTVTPKVFETLLALLEGPTAIAFLESNGDPVAVAKALVDAARETRVLEVRGGLLEGRPIEAAEIESLAKLPPLDALRSQVLAAVIGPVTGIVALFTAPLQDLYGLIDARIEQLQEQGDTSGAAAPEAEATAEPEAETETPTENPPDSDASASESEQAEEEQ